MKIALSDLYYYPLKLYVVVSCFLYFRKLRVVGIKNIPSKDPVIYAINHQNALLDALVVHSVSWRNPFFLTRADIFKSGLVDKFLRGIKMLPIYRIRDGFDSIKKNDVIFEASKDILMNGGVVGIFPEGSHNLRHRLRPMKKGIARIAFMAEEAANFGLNVKIVPIGIQYESHFSPNGRTLVTYGKPINVADYQQIFEEDPNKAFKELLTEISDRIKSLIINIEATDYDWVYKAFMQERVYKKRLINQLKSDQSLIDCLENEKIFEDKPDRKNFLIQLLAKAWYFIWQIVGFIPRSIVKRMVTKRTRDKHFFGTNRFAYSMIIYPVFFFCLYLLIRFLLF